MAVRKVATAGDFATEFTALKNSAHTAVSHIKSVARQSAERLEDTIRQRPMTSIVIALGVGCLLTLLWHRR